MSAAQPKPRTEIVAGTKLAGRYEVRARLGAGGMATVFRAFDESAERLVALKLFDPASSDRQEGRAHFEREYRTLATLRHPRIIEVCDYGLYEDEPFYAMELLDGEDLRRLSPLPYPQACAYLRDVASSLALVHARGLLHRDVSPLNVRITDGGRAKLIDFGALASFGLHREAIGTPSCIAPEVFQALPLDARADLFSLGAVLYFVLTGRHAYPARTLAQAPLLWQMAPAKPSELLRELGEAPLAIPAELDELVISLLSIDPAGRPASAGLVIERLNTIAGLEPDADVDVIESYLAVTSTVGRDAELLRIRDALDAAAAGRGGALLITGATGSGKSRALSELAIEAQLRGAAVIQIDAALGRASGALAHSLIDRAVYERPQVALSALAAHAPTLVAFHSDLAKRVPGTAAAPIPQEADEWRMRVQGEIIAWLEAMSRRATVVIAIDNLDQADEFSASLALALSARSRGRPLLLAAAAQTSTAGPAQAAVSRLAAAARLVELHPLDGSQTVQLVRSLFGDAPHTVRVAEWIYNVSDGNPMDSVELMRHLVRGNVIRYLEGTWILPQELSAHELPEDLASVWQGRLERLGPAARGVARAVSIYRRAFSPEQVEVVCGSLSSSQVSDALDELIVHGVLKAEGDSYRFRLAPLQKALEAELEDSERQKLHARVAEHLLPGLPRLRRGDEAGLDGDSILSMFETGSHLIEAGDVERGTALSLEACRLLLYNSSQVAAAHVPFLERLLARAHDRESDAFLLPICLLAAAGYTVERHLAERYGDEAVDAARRATGLTRAERLRPTVGALLGTLLGVLAGVGHHLRTPRTRRTLSLLERLQTLLLVVTSLVGTATICRDAARARRLTAVLEPFGVFGKRNVLALFHEYSERLTQIVSSREAEAYAGWQALLVRLEDPRGMPGVPAATHDLMLGGALYALGVLENFQESAEVLRLVERLEGLGSKLYELVAAQLRTQYHAQRGEMELAKTWAERVEMLAVQKGTAWQAEVWVSSVFGVASYQVADLVALKRAREQLALLAKSLPALAGATRGRYLLLRGDYRGALDELEGIRELMPPGSFSGWATEWASLAETYNLVGLPEQARAVCLEALGHVGPEARRFSWLYGEPELQLAIAEALRGEHDLAARQLDGLIAEREQTNALASLGRLHEARARVALLAKDASAFDRHFAEMSRVYRQTGAQGLLRKCERLRDLGDVAFRRSAERAAFDPFALTDEERAVAEQFTSEVSEQNDYRYAYRRALELVVFHLAGGSGYLFVVGGTGETELVAAHGSPEPPTWVVDNVHTLVGGFDADKTVANGDVATIVVNATVFQDADELSTLPLVLQRGGQSTLIGVVAVVRGNEALRAPSTAFLEQAAHAIAQVQTRSRGAHTE